MLRRIERERKREEHLFYTSLKYTKTGDLIVNLLKRMAETLSVSIDAVLEHAKKKKIVKQIPKTPKEKINLIKKILKDPLIKEMLEFYEIIRNLEKYKKVTEHEFRKNVTLKIFVGERVISLNLTKLEEIQKRFEDFLKLIEKFLRSK